jgi:GTPase
MPFRDVMEISVQGGKGGDGGMSFLRLKYVPKGGPDGGHGGDGGSVWLEAVDDITSLDRLVTRQVYKGGTGQQGEGRNKAGLGGEDVVVTVPIGTIASDAETGEVLADLINVGQRAVVAAGGVGGRGNSAFASSTRRAPRFSEYGTPGERRRLRLELRTIADVGLLGYPNAGKSSLLGALSNARPKVAAYPFTTLSPNLGVVERNHQRITIADIPGIIEDAHLGKGLGLEFLRHITRTRLLCYVVDLAEDPLSHLAALQHELRAYDPALLERPAVVVLNKLDLVGPDEAEAAAELLTEFGLPLFALSATGGEGVESFISTLFDLVPAAPPVPGPMAAPPRIQEDPLRVARDMTGTRWIVRGRAVEDLVNRFDHTNRDAVAYLQRHFVNLGVYKLLAKTGASSGEEVVIGDAVFDYFDEVTIEQQARAEEESERIEEEAAERRWVERMAADEVAAAAADEESGSAEDPPLPQ